MKLYAVYHWQLGYYHFGYGQFNNMHDYNFTIEQYTTGDVDVANRLSTEYKASIVEI